MTDFIVKHWLTVLFGFVTAALGAGYRNLSQRVKKEREAGKAMQAGMVALLSDRLIQLHKLHTERGYCHINDKKNVESLFRAYHSLGGNGTITDLYNKLLALPTEKKVEE